MSTPIETTDPRPAELTAFELLKETLATTAQLAEKQVELLRAEVKATIAEERRRVITLSVGAATALCGLSVMLTAGALAAGFATGHPALFVLGMGVVLAGAAAALLIAGIRGLAATRVPSSRSIVEEEIEWAREKLQETRSSTSPERSNGYAVVVSR